MRKFVDFVDIEFTLRRDFLSTHVVVLRNRIVFCSIPYRRTAKAIAKRVHAKTCALSKHECGVQTGCSRAASQMISPTVRANANAAFGHSNCSRVRRSSACRCALMSYRCAAHVLHALHDGRAPLQSPRSALHAASVAHVSTTGRCRRIAANVCDCGRRHGMCIGSANDYADAPVSARWSTLKIEGVCHGVVTPLTRVAG